MVHVIAVVLSDITEASGVYSWIVNDVLREGLRDTFHEVITESVEPTVPRAMRTRAQEVLRGYICAHLAEGDGFVFLIIALFWDGHSDASKTAFAQLKHLTDEGHEAYQQLVPPASASSSRRAPSPSVKVLIQALNAKKGAHTMRENRAALVQSLAKRIKLPTLIAGSNGAPSGAIAATAGADVSTAATPSIGEKDITPDAVLAAVDKGQGECFFVIAAPDGAALHARVAELKANCAEAGVGCAPVLPEPREVQVAAASTSEAATTSPSTASPANNKTVVAQEFLLRRDCPGTHLEMRLVMCGNVDSGKSTLTSVLTRGCRDDGRGFARSFVFNHKHEAATGRTSSIGENHLGFSATGEVVNYTASNGTTAVAHTPSATAGAADTLSRGSQKNDSKDVASRSALAATATARQYTLQELSSRSTKVLTLYDLAGHERYLNTTVLGLTRSMPDYACIVISANNGIQRMTKEHLALCLALNLPFFIVVTRIDAVPENVHKETMATINKILKISTVRRLPYPVRRTEELILAAKHLRSDRITPIFELSNVSGSGVPELLRFLNLLPRRQDWRPARRLPAEMIIDSTFFVTGVGTVVGGIVTQGALRVNDTVLLGPDGVGNYRPVTIKSIHIKSTDSDIVEAGSDAAFCLKKEKRGTIRKGSILAAPQPPPVAYWRFEADVTILYHSTTITTNYEPVIHSPTVRQSARITYVAQEVLRTGDHSLVHFHFLYRPEFMKVGQRLIFREGRTKGIGVVTKLVVEADENRFPKHRKMKRAPRP